MVTTATTRGTDDADESSDEGIPNPAAAVNTDAVNADVVTADRGGADTDTTASSGG